MIRNLIQTDAAINPGNSRRRAPRPGGNVIGINTAVAQTAEGIGFAIPINIARPIMQQALAGQDARPAVDRHPLRGPHAGDRSQEQRCRSSTGAWIHGADELRPGAATRSGADSPAAAAGLKDGDIIVAVDGHGDRRRPPARRRPHPVRPGPDGRPRGPPRRPEADAHPHPGDATRQPVAADPVRARRAGVGRARSVRPPDRPVRLAGRRSARSADLDPGPGELRRGAAPPACGPGP